MSALGSNTFRSLRVRNFRLWFTGQTISIAGTFMQMVAQAWLVLSLSHDSSFAAGLVTALQFIPTLVFGLWGGLMADRLDKRKLLMATQAAMALIAGGLALVTLTGVVELWMVYIASFLTGMATFPDTPARQSFVSEMVNEEDLSNAVSLNTGTFNGARVVGPSIAGVALVVGGPGLCFLVNAASYLAVIVALRMMRTSELRTHPPVVRAKGQLREGLAYAWSQPVLRAHILLSAVLGSFGLAFQVITPLLVKISFHGTAGTYTVMMVLQGIGALAGAVVLASRPATGRIVVISGLVFGGAQVLSGVAPSLPLAMLVMPLLGFAMITTLACSNAIVQMESAPSLRGRVIGLRSLVLLGGTPVGGIATGTISEYLGPRFALLVAGALVMVATAVCARGVLGRQSSVHVTPAQELDDELLIAPA